jgi:hypothetical protein
MHLGDRVHPAAMQQLMTEASNKQHSAGLIPLGTDARLHGGGDGHADPQPVHAPPCREGQPHRQRDAEHPVGPQVDRHAQLLPGGAPDDACSGGVSTGLRLASLHVSAWSAQTLLLTIHPNRCWLVRLLPLITCRRFSVEQETARKQDSSVS